LSTLILHHDDCLVHDPGPHHAESPARVRAVLAGLQGIPGTEFLPAPLASLEQIQRVHDAGWWENLVERERTEGRAVLDPDTLISPGSINATLRGSGATCFAVDQLFANRAVNAFCAVRPPGHHAARAMAMGFCLLNHVAVGARHALAMHPVDRVAILDFDVHHGNGTQSIFEQSPDVLYISSHQMPLYPGTGRADETGVGNILNLPLKPGAGSADFRRAWSRKGLPRLREFAPDIILVSAGFDGHCKDPLGQLELKDEDYAWITKEICEIAAEVCGGRVISVLEGGYNLEALASASCAHVEVLATQRV